MKLKYEQVEDKTLFSAQKVRCCLCGVMMPPNTSNTCLGCLKTQIDVAEGVST